MRNSPGLSRKSPLIDGVMVVVTARRSAFLRRRSAEADGAGARNQKAGVHVDLYVALRTQRRSAQRGRLSAVQECRRLRAHHARHGGLSGAARDAAQPAKRQRRQSRADRSRARAELLATLPAPVLCEWQARPLLGAYGIGGGEAGMLAHSAAEAEAAARALGAAGRAESPIRRYSAQDRSRRRRAQCHRATTSRDAYERVLAAAKSHAPHARIDGVLVQPMARARTRSHSRRQPRCRPGARC